MFGDAEDTKLMLAAMDTERVAKLFAERQARRFQAAVAAMQAIVQTRANGLGMPEWDPVQDAADAVAHADALLAALEGSKP